MEKKKGPSHLREEPHIKLTKIIITETEKNMKKESNVLKIKKNALLVLCAITVTSLVGNVGQSVLYNKALAIADEDYMMLDELYDNAVTELNTVQEQLDEVTTLYYRTGE